ncbi:MAG TPA: Fe-S cluster assembly ATPase SufC, partial [Candidatus Babeliales bacterium]|nr:Fe-S cluster assembly ATPase SufC [Candidatus Babeliales bacterium]
TNGSVSYKEQDITHISPDKRAKLGIFLAFQNPLEVPGVKVATFLKEAHQALTGQHLSVTEFNTLLQDTLQSLGLDPSFAYRNLNEGFSGGEKKRLELLQMVILNPSLIILDEIDSGLDIDALQLVANAINHLKLNNPQLSIVIITHYQRILTFLKPDYVHVVANGMIIKSGDSALAQELENKGYHGAIFN